MFRKSLISLTAKRAFSQSARLRAATVTATTGPSPGFSVFSEALEKDIRTRIDNLPGAGKIFQNPDGTPRTPTDYELQEVAALGLLPKRRFSLIDYFKLSTSQYELLLDNMTDLKDYIDQGKVVLDKIPYEDPKTGEIKWSVIREESNEGWEKIMYYGFVPALILMGVVGISKKDDNIKQWAIDELRLRANERYEGAAAAEIDAQPRTPEEQKARDELVVERILSGEYDNLAGLMKNRLKAEALLETKKSEAAANASE